MGLDHLGRELVKVAACARMPRVQDAADLRRALSRAMHAYGLSHDVSADEIEREIDRAVEKRRCRTASGS